MHNDRCWAVFTRLTDLSVARYTPVYSSVAAATAAIGEGSCRDVHRAWEKFGPHSFSVRATQIFVSEHLLAWSMLDKIPVTSTVATVFVENALNYTRDGWDVRLDATSENVVVAVSDTSSTPAIRRERAPGNPPAGLDIVAAVCSRWGSTPTSRGKTMWAQIDPDDTIAGIAELLQ